MAGVPVWTVGEVLASADVNTWFVPLAAFKGSNESVTSSTTLQNDNDLVLPVAANAIYEFSCQIFFVAPTGDIKWDWAVPAGAALLYQALHNEGSSTGLNNSATAQADTDVIFGVGDGSNVQAAHMFGELTTSTTTGNLQLKWAQNTSSGTATTVRQNSKLILRRIG